MKKLVVPFALLLSACGAAAPAEEESVAPLHATCAPVERSHIEDVRTLDGTVVTPPDRTALVSAQIAGRILSVLVRDGDPVVAGQRLVEIDPGTAADLAHLADAHVAGAAAAAAHAHLALDRSQRLVDRGIAARQELDDATSLAEEQDAALVAARASRTEAHRMLERSHVTAPISGVVTRVARHAGELVDGTPLTPILEIADPSVLEVQASAPPADLIALRTGATARVELPAIPGLSFDATARTVAPALDPATGTGVVRFALVLTADQPRPPLSLLARVHVTVATRDALTVPLDALRGAPDGGTEVLVCEGAVVHVRPVTVGLRGERAEITSGLDGTESIVIAGVVGVDDETPLAEPSTQPRDDSTPAP